MLEWEVMNSKLGKLEEAPLFIEDISASSIFDIRKKAIDYVCNKGVKVLVIDYLQLITVNNRDEIYFNKKKEISIVTRELKFLAKELNVPIIVLSELSRAVEKRKGMELFLKMLRSI